MKLEDLITRREAADIIGVSPQAVSQMADDGRLTPVLTLDNGQTLYDRNDVVKFADDRRAAMGTPA